MEYVSPLTKYVYENYDALLHIEALFNVKELQNVDPPKNRRPAWHETELNKIFMKRAAEESLRMDTVRFPDRFDGAGGGHVAERI